MDDYLNAHIGGMVKLNYIEINKLINVDVILSDLPADQFITTFSFDLCKMYLLWDKELLNKVSSISNDSNKDKIITSFLESIMLSPYTVNDIENKKMTINLNNINEKHLHYYLGKHYLKMKEKFPEYELSSRYHDKNPEIERIDKLSSIVQWHNLQDKLNKNNLIKNKMKI